MKQTGEPAAIRLGWGLCLVRVSGRVLPPPSLTTYSAPGVGSTRIAICGRATRALMTLCINTASGKQACLPSLFKKQVNGPADIRGPGCVDSGGSGGSGSGCGVARTWVRDCGDVGVTDGDGAAEAFCTGLGCILGSSSRIVGIGF